MVALGTAIAAEPGPAPTISGDPIVGETLTANVAPGGSSVVYKWERCDPGNALADCPNGIGFGEVVLEGNGQSSYLLTGADLSKWIRVQTHDAAEGSQGFVPSAPVGPVTGSAGSPPPPPPPTVKPKHGINVVVHPSFGQAKYKLPGQRGFTILENTELLPFGTTFNTKKGGAVFIAATGEFGEQTPDSSMEFFGGIFKLKQGAKENAPAVAKLKGKLPKNCKKGGKSKASIAGEGPEAITSGRRRRRLWGRGRGRYRTRGRRGTGSVRGTTWLTKDTCKGTFFKVPKKGNHEGSGIKVNPKKKGKKNVFLGPGESYLAE